MDTPTAQRLEFRVLLRTATAKDAIMAAAVLERADLVPQTCADLPAVVRAIGQGAGALLVAEEVLDGSGAGELAGVLSTQPQWSDLPVLILARQGADSAALLNAIDQLPNVTVLERPIRVASLVSALRSALRARRRQYELRGVLAGLREADQRKNEFLATLAHELRNPMAPLGTSLAILMRKAPPPDAARHYYEMMMRQLDHMVRLVNDLMEISRITRGKIDLRLEVLDLGRTIHEAVELSRPLLDARGQTLQVHSSDVPMTVRGDGVRLTQVFSNLLNNAAKYSPEGGRVQVAIARVGGDAVVTVSDEGAGIANDMLASIFEMFVQVSGTARAAQGGLGIGLTLVKSLVELHGGAVRATSAGLNRGSSFEVQLPLVEGHDGRSGTARLPPAALGLLGSVLVVDDNRDAADSLCELLDLHGARTVVAHGGAEALRLAAATRPSVGILDIGMPGMDGCELALRLREDPANDGMVLVALTGWGQQNDKERIARSGFAHHLLKPVDIDALIALLTRLAGGDAAPAGG